MTWLGKLYGGRHYDALVEWADGVAKNGVGNKLPEILVPLQFERAEDGLKMD